MAQSAFGTQENGFMQGLGALLSQIFTPREAGAEVIAGDPGAKELIRHTTQGRTALPQYVSMYEQADARPEAVVVRTQKNPIPSPAGPALGQYYPAHLPIGQSMPHNAATMLDMFYPRQGQAFDPRVFAGQQQQNQQAIEAGGGSMDRQEPYYMGWTAPAQFTPEHTLSHELGHFVTDQSGAWRAVQGQEPYNEERLVQHAAGQPFDPTFLRYLAQSPLISALLRGAAQQQMGVP